MTPVRRIIPRVDTDGVCLHRTGKNTLRDSGDPTELAARYAEEGADEVALFEMGAEIRPAYVEAVRRVAAQIQIPVIAGPSIRSVEDARLLLRAGAASVVVDSAEMDEPQLLTGLAEEFGAPAVVLAIRAKRREQGDAWMVTSREGEEHALLDAVEWAAEAATLGAGQILTWSAERDRTRDGFDCALTAAISSAVNVPVIAAGGAGTPDDFLEVFTDGRADAALASSIFEEGVASVRSLKQYLESRGLPVRT